MSGFEPTLSGNFFPIPINPNFDVLCMGLICCQFRNIDLFLTSARQGIVSVFYVWTSIKVRGGKPRNFTINKIGKKFLSLDCSQKQNTKWTVFSFSIPLNVDGSSPKFGAKAILFFLGVSDPIFILTQLTSVRSSLTRKLWTLAHEFSFKTEDHSQKHVGLPKFEN